MNLNIDNDLILLNLFVSRHREFVPVRLTGWILGKFGNKLSPVLLVLVS